MADTRQLYQEVILDHNRKPRNWGSLPDATHKAEGVNPLCGDRLHVDVKLAADAGRSDRFRRRVVRDLQGVGVDDDDRGQRARHERTRSSSSRSSATWRRASSTPAKEPHHLGRLTVFSGVRDLPTRVKCAILPWHTLHAAFNSIGTTSTESDADPMHEAAPGGMA